MAPAVSGLDTNVGLYTTMFDEKEGRKTTFPFGVRTALSHVPPDAMGPTFENPDAESENVLYIPIFGVDDNGYGLMTTFPFGKRTPALNKDWPCPAIGPTFVIVRVVGLKTPIFAESRGTMIMLPVGDTRPPWNLLVPAAPT
jgi:hypothetical protein